MLKAYVARSIKALPAALRSPAARIVLFFGLLGAVCQTVAHSVQWACDQSAALRHAWAALPPATADSAGRGIGAMLDAVSALVVLGVMRRLGDPAVQWRRWLGGAGAAGEALTGFCLGAVLIAVQVLTLLACHAYRLLAVDHTYPWLLEGTFFARTGLIEEVVFRGYAFQVIRTRYGTRRALLVSSLLFGLWHLGNAAYLGQWHGHLKLFVNVEVLWQTLLFTTVAGAMYGAAYLATRRLWLAIGLHTAWDLFNGVVFEGGLVYGGACLVASWVTLDGYWSAVSVCLLAALGLLQLAKRRGGGPGARGNVFSDNAEQNAPRPVYALAVLETVVDVLCISLRLKPRGGASAGRRAG